MRADNRGEGGILALLALILQQERRSPTRAGGSLLVGLGLFGAALLYGDGIITPAISVLGAVEGLERRRRRRSRRMVVPISVVVLFVLFTVQRFGTGRVGRAVRPDHVRLVRDDRRRWASSEIVQRAAHPRRPQSAARRRRSSPPTGASAFLALGAVVLAVTGAEALYADMGHFGKRPIRLAWFALVMPALLLNYFGQGALLLRESGGGRRTRSTSSRRASMLVPLVVLATLAAVIASQALISGAFSLTQQAVQLGYSPRVTIVHTSAQRGRPDLHARRSTASLMIGCLVLVVAFQSSTASAPRTASPSPARWRSRRCSSTSWRGRAGTGRSTHVRADHGSRSSRSTCRSFAANVDQDRVRRLGADRHRASACSR